MLAERKRCWGSTLHRPTALCKNASIVVGIIIALSLLHSANRCRQWPAWPGGKMRERIWLCIGRFFQRLARVCYVQAKVCWRCGVPGMHTFFHGMFWCDDCYGRWAVYVHKHDCSAHPWHGIRPVHRSGPQPTTAPCCSGEAPTLPKVATSA